MMGDKNSWYLLVFMIWSQHGQVVFVVILENSTVVTVFTAIFLSCTYAAAVMIALASICSIILSQKYHVPVRDEPRLITCFEARNSIAH